MIATTGKGNALRALMSGLLIHNNESRNPRYVFCRTDVRHNSRAFIPSKKYFLLLRLCSIFMWRLVTKPRITSHLRERILAAFQALLNHICKRHHVNFFYVLCWRPVQRFHCMAFILTACNVASSWCTTLRPVSTRLVPTN